MVFPSQPPSVAADFHIDLVLPVIQPWRQGKQPTDIAPQRRELVSLE
jgi:hypothetical protein